MSRATSDSHIGSEPRGLAGRRIDEEFTQGGASRLAPLPARARHFRPFRHTRCGRRMQGPACPLPSFPCGSRGTPGRRPQSMETQPMPGWLALTCGALVILAAAYLLYVVLRPEDF
ncbi:potassium-transporting ATPase subunit F [Pseudoxanthomonas sp. UC19_8]